uniref:Uncharacterized protein n=1 Tax=Caenorhabditis japonica TaxID=281687 RepID=A0A8R1E5A1_CAEJA
MNVEPGSKGVPDNITTSKLAKKAAAVVVEVKEKEKEKEKEKGSDDREKLKPKAPSKQKPQDKDMPRWNLKEKEDRIQSVKEYYQVLIELLGYIHAPVRKCAPLKSAETFLAVHGVQDLKCGRSLIC